MASFYKRNGYDLYITMGGTQLPACEIHGQINISKTEGGSTTASFQRLPPSGTQSPEFEQGQTLTIDIRVPAGLYRVFTGVVDVPVLDLINQVTTYNCTDDRDKKLKAAPISFIQKVGFYSEDLFGKAEDNVDELSRRLTTTPASVDFDNYGTLTLTPWQPKTVPDIALADNQVYYREPNVDFRSRIKTINTVNLDVDYTYVRLQQKIIKYNWAGSFFTDFPSWYQNGWPSFPTREMIRGAAEGVGYNIVGTFSFLPLWEAKWYVVNGINIYWNPNSQQVNYTNRQDKDGNDIVDENGNKVKDISSVVVTDTSSHLCRAANWTSSKRFSQNVVEQYALKIRAPQSVTKFGEVPQGDSYSVSAEYDDTEWSESTADAQNANNFYINQDNNRQQLNNAFYTALNRAKTTLLKSHRDVTVNFETPINPIIDITHTVGVTSFEVECRGKATAITHSINLETGEASTAVTLSLSRIQGVTVEDPLTVPPIPSEDPSYIGGPETIRLQSHYGIDPTLESNANKNGHFGNRVLDNRNGRPGARTDFQEVFIVDTPDVPELVTGNRELPSSKNYNIAIPNDYLVVRYK